MYIFKRKNNQQKLNSFKRQWGSDKRVIPLPVVHPHPSSKAITFSRAAIILTVFFWALYVIATVIRQFFEGQVSFKFTMQAISYLVVVTFLIFSALMYLIARQGALQRFSKHVRIPRAKLDEHFVKNPSNITVLIPSYSEEPSVIRKTLLSAAFQEYPNMNIVLLIDDNPNPNNQSVLNRLNETRSLASNIMDLFTYPKTVFSKALKDFEISKQPSKNLASKATIKKLAGYYTQAANWLNDLATKELVEDHVDTFFVSEVIDKLAKDLSLIAKALNEAQKSTERISTTRVHQLYQRLTWIFSSEVSVFERKQYISLSHEANKAMNLNSYIGLMGGSYIKSVTPDGMALVPIKNTKTADLTIPDSEYLLTLDADSILLKEYCLRLVYFLEQPDNDRVAVTQTPYSSFRGSNTRIERLAGATTDIQHILHQGMTYYGATFWVGANAVIRKKALEDIVEKEWVGGYEIKRYIQDRTVIEDTESSIDLGLHGWKLINYPERLSYSATPPDFGSLVVQRRRWANGGLLILPKFLAQIKRRKRLNETVSLTEVLLRLNYMASIAWASFGLVFLLTFPYDNRLLSPLVVLASLPYFMAMASDLKNCGYKRTDVLRIYGFNLILLPVNLSGVLKSIQQALTNKKIPFARTPKIKNRTTSPAIYVITPLLIISFSVFTLWRDEIIHNWGNATFAAINISLAIWALVAYIGIRNTLADIWVGLTKWLYVEVKPKSTIKELASEKPFQWKSVLYHGEAESNLPHSELFKNQGYTK